MDWESAAGGAASVATPLINAADAMAAKDQCLRQQLHCFASRGLRRGAVVWARLPARLVPAPSIARAQGQCEGRPPIMWPGQVIAINAATKLVSVLFFGRQPSRPETQQRVDAANRRAKLKVSRMNRLGRKSHTACATTRGGSTATERRRHGTAPAVQTAGHRGHGNPEQPPIGAVLEQKAESKGLTSKYAGVSWHKGCRPSTRPQSAFVQIKRCAFHSYRPVQ